MTGCAAGPARGARALHPLQVARAVALAKASSPTGALLAGLYTGLLVWLLPRPRSRRATTPGSAPGSALAALLLTAAALSLERACRTPDAVRPGRRARSRVRVVTTSDDLDALSTEDLRRRAFDKAKAARDSGFFWDLATHLRGARAIEGEDGSGGGLTGTITELVDLAREMMGKGLGDDEPLVRARLLDYLRD